MATDFFDHMIILKPPGSQEPIFEVSGVAGTDFRGLWARWNQFSKSLGSPEPILEVSRVARADFWDPGWPEFLKYVELASFPLF